MHCDCADDVFVEIHQVCDKIFTFPDSSVTQTDVMRLPCRQEPERQTEFAKLWHQGYFDLLLVQFRAFSHPLWSVYICHFTFCAHLQ